MVTSTRTSVRLHGRVSAKATRQHCRDLIGYRDDPTYKYLETFGFLERGWISEEPLRKVIAAKKSISGLSADAPYKQLFTLALMSVLVNSASNVKFGPEIYCSTSKSDSAVLEDVLTKVREMSAELSIVSGIVLPAFTMVLNGDSRECSKVIRAHSKRKFAAVICSPPYPTEHDYTRNSRLELALLEEVTNIESLRLIKRQMIRSHTKNIYKADDDAALVASIPEIQRIATRLDRKSARSGSGFVRYYPFVVREYFGGMYRHFQSVVPLLKEGANCAYVVGDQCSYLKEFIPTAELLSIVAAKAGLETVEIRRWRARKSTTGKRRIDEKILLLKLAGGKDVNA